MGFGAEMCTACKVCEFSMICLNLRDDNIYRMYMYMPGNDDLREGTTCYGFVYMGRNFMFGEVVASGMVSVLASRSSSSGLNLGQGHCVVFLGKTLSQCLSPSRCINGYRQI